MLYLLIEALILLKSVGVMQANLFTRLVINSLGRGHTHARIQTIRTGSILRNQTRAGLAGTYGMPFVTKIQYTLRHCELPYYVVSSSPQISGYHCLFHNVVTSLAMLSLSPDVTTFLRCHKVKMIHLDSGIDCGFL